jgi:hypothetical protein
MRKSKVYFQARLASTNNANYDIEYVQRYASKEAADDAGEDSDDEDEMSSVGSFGSAEDEEPAGTMDEV